MHALPARQVRPLPVENGDLAWEDLVTYRKLMATTLGAVLAASILWPVDAQAQRRRVVRRAPVRSSVVVGVGVSPFYYRPYYRPFFYDPWFAYGYPYGWFPPPYGYGYGYGYPESSLRLQVEPKQTEVFIDGYWAGTVDDFDGFFQRLHLEPGEHDLELYLQGYKSAKQKIYLQPNGTFRIRHAMVPLAPGDTPDPRPAARAGSPQRGSQGSYDAFGRPGRPEPPDRPESPDRPGRPEPPDRPNRSDRSAFGTLAIRVQPGEAEVLVDGEEWDGPDGSERLVIQLPEGEHRIEVRRDGYSTYTSTVRIRDGETTNLNVSLARE
jgi:hypothetical protein